MTSKKRREESRAKKAEDSKQPAIPEPPAPPILPTPLTGLDWMTLNNIIGPNNGDAAERRRAVLRLMQHAVIREKIIVDLALRLDNLHTVCSERGKYADNMARDYCEEKLDFIVKTVNAAADPELAATDAAKIGKPV